MVISMPILPKLDERSLLPQYVQIYEGLKKEILSCTLKEQTRLPSVRKLADFLGISTTPVETAYSQLTAEGFIESRPRSGYYVQTIPEPYPYCPEEDSLLAAVQSIERTVPARDMRDYPFDFHLSKNDFSLFPFRIWRKLFHQVFRPEHHELLAYGDPQGEPGLHRAIASYLYQYRGVTCSPDQIVVGAEQHLLIGGFSQVLAPAVCIHYMVLPRSLVDAYQRMEHRLLNEQSSSRMNQRILQLFMEQGHLERHIRKMRNLYRQKHDLLLSSIHKYFGSSAAVIG